MSDSEFNMKTDIVSCVKLGLSPWRKNIVCQRAGYWGEHLDLRKKLQEAVGDCVICTLHKILQWSN